MNTRRDFLKLLGTSGVALSVDTAFGDEITEGIKKAKSRKAKRDMSLFAAPKIDELRVGIIGMGSRGTMGLHRFHLFEGARVVAICDCNPAKIPPALKYIEEKKLPKVDVYSASEEDYKRLCDRDDIDLVFITTPWKWHVPMAVYAMNAGKHCAIEVPAARTLSEAWALVETSERTARHCFQLENCVYDYKEAATIIMASKGIFGEIIHTEAAYIHKLVHKLPQKETWRWAENSRDGNLYPTHGVGPVALAMGINRGDNFDYLSSVSSADFTWYTHNERAKKEVPSIKIFKKYRGNINTSIIRTKRGKTMLVQHDISSDRPYDRKHLISGTKGFFQKYPITMMLGDKLLERKEFDKLSEENSPDFIKKIGDFAKKIGGHGGMDTIMIYRLVECLRNGMPLDMSVYDAAAWSAITPLSIWSVANRSNSIDFPDFSAGAWRTTKNLAFNTVG